MKHSVVHYILARAAERSTWTGLVAFAAALGVTLTPDQTAAIVTAGVSLVGLVFAFMPDPKK